MSWVNVLRERSGGPRSCMLYVIIDRHADNTNPHSIVRRTQIQAETADKQPHPPRHGWMHITAKASSIAGARRGGYAETKHGWIRP